MLRAATPVASLAFPQLALAILALLLPISSASRAADKPTDGLVVQIPATLTTESTGRLRSLLHGPIHRFQQGAARQGGQFVLICDFNPDDKPAESDDFGAAYELAKYLRSLDGVRTIAFVHGDVRRHSVLPALACGERVYSDKGRLGQVAASGKKLPRAERIAYEEITQGRISDVLVRKMFDADLEVMKLGPDFVDGAKPRPGAQAVAGLPARETAFYTFALARDLGLCDPLPRGNVEAVRTAFEVPRVGQRALDKAVCWRIPLDGPINGELVEQTQRRVERALRARANVLIFELGCAGGSADQAHRLGLYFAALGQREPPVETVGYVTTKARNLATFLALGCNKIVMQRDDERDAKEPDEEEGLGGFRLFLNRHPSTETLRKAAEVQGKGGDAEQKLGEATASIEEALRSQLAEVAVKQSYPEVLVAGRFNRALKIHQVERAKGAVGGRKLMSDEEYQADQKGKREWRSVRMVKPWGGDPKLEGRYLTLTPRQAKEIDVASDTVKDLPELYQSVGVKAEEVKVAEADWLDGLADFLRHPWTSVLLVMVGITCLILELKMPGVGLPGVVAAICFVLFFWAHSQLHGQITWLWILLFALGLALIGLEIFVLPGFGVCGISGVLLLLASLGLIAYGHWPKSSSEWVDFGHKLGPFGVSLCGSLLLVALVLRYLPHIPILNRLMLKPAEDGEEGSAESDYPMHAEMQALLGAIGVAATPLRPAGKTQFGEAYIDVVAEGGYVMPGTRVQVVEVEGNRVVVKEV